ncbi:PP2C family serine/threonine-protein phosphatase [Arenimonas sp.]|uniref:PP2C family serine/threonine-protein phosphatase n=1 Tax=Arenimonas sp. TaxID=1872635 RepID=UPI0039E3FD46
MAWRVFAAAAIGKSHIDGGIPCQDAFAQGVVGDTLIAVVCDGAGSQAFSHLGAQVVSAAVVEGLSQRLAQGEPLCALDANAFASLAVDVVARARAAIEARALAESHELGNYACTLVGAIADGERGFFFHIGDGQAVMDGRDAAQPALMSLPENGEYANETYFVTGEAWREHLRVTPIDRAQRAIVLMSDGAAPFVMMKGNAGLYRPFMDPVERFLATVSEADGSRGLAGTLEDPRTYTITGDDKTLLIALWQ